MDGGRAAISARISARERAFLEFLFFMAYIIVYAYVKSKRKINGACINFSVHPFLFFESAGDGGKTENMV